MQLRLIEPTIDEREAADLLRQFLRDRSRRPFTLDQLLEAIGAGNPTIRRRITRI